MRTRVAIVAALTLLVGSLAADPTAEADAAPRKTSEPIRHGVFEYAEGTGCTSTQVSINIGSQRVVRAQPDEGDSVGLEADVLDVAISDGRVVWTVGPDARTCELNDSIFGAGNWSWDTWDDQLWEVVYRQRVYAIKASLYGGVQSIAGLRVRPRTRRSTPTVGRVKRALGKPGSVRRGRGRNHLVCTTRWRHLGLTAYFVNYGGSPPCRDGFLQTATIAGPRAVAWSARIGRRPGITPGTSLGYLENEFIGEADAFGRRLWTLSEVWVPYGDSGFIPAVSARLAGGGRLQATDVINGFRLYIGAGGD